MKSITKRANLRLTEVRKFLSDGKRIVQGFASTAAIDRTGDIVVPAGGRWSLPVPLLWAHSHVEPIGWVRTINRRSDGIWIEAEFATGFTRADETWAMVMAGLVEGFSIGFLPLESEPLPSGGRRFTSWELMEVSVVVVPANAQARISRKPEAGAKAGSVPLGQGPVKLTAITIARGQGAVKLVAGEKPHAGVPLLSPPKSVKLVRVGGSVPLIRRPQ